MDASTGDDVFLFDGFRLDQNGGGLFGADGNSVPLGSRALDLLKLLVERNGQLVPRQQIMDAVWPGLAVEEGNLTVQVSALRKALDRGRSGASCIQTVPGRGYRFLPAVTRPARDEDAASHADAEVSAQPLTPSMPEAAPPGRRSARQWRRLAAFVAACATVAAVLLIAGFPPAWWHSRAAVPPRLSVVVLPFENLSGNPGDDFLADAVTEDLTTELSRWPAMVVIARQSAYAYRGSPVDVRKIGEDFGVRYVLHGSVRKMDDTLRVNAQLVAAESGTHLWAERFDQGPKAPNAGQEGIVANVAQAVNMTLMDVESARGKRERPTDPDALDLVIRARSLALHPMGPKEDAERQPLYEQALRIDPNSIPALTGLAQSLIWGAKTEDELERASHLLAKAASISPDHLLVLQNVAHLMLAQERFLDALAAFRRILDEYPNAPFAYANIGDCLVRTGRTEEAIPMFEAADRLDPRNAFRWNWYGNLGFALLLLGRDEELIVWTQRALAANPSAVPFVRAWFNLRLAASSARLGDQEGAHRAVAEANRVWPYDTVRSHWPDDPSSRVYAAQIERFQAAMRLAGHRDHAEEDADFGATPDDSLHLELAGLTPTTVPGAAIIRTVELASLLANQKPIVIDPLMYSWGRSIPGAIGLRRVGWGGSTSDHAQERLRRKMQSLTRGDLSQPIVAVGFNSERFDGRNLALRLVALGYSHVYWYRGGREAWETAGLPETETDVQDW